MAYTAEKRQACRYLCARVKRALLFHSTSLYNLALKKIINSIDDRRMYSPFWCSLGIRQRSTTDVLYWIFLDVLQTCDPITWLQVLALQSIRSADVRVDRVKNYLTLWIPTSQYQVETTWLHGVDAPGQQVTGKRKSHQSETAEENADFEYLKMSNILWLHENVSPIQLSKHKDPMNDLNHAMYYLRISCTYTAGLFLVEARVHIGKALQLQKKILSQLLTSKPLLNGPTWRSDKIFFKDKLCREPPDMSLW